MQVMPIGKIYKWAVGFKAFRQRKFAYLAFKRKKDAIEFMNKTNCTEKMEAFIFKVKH